jgi:hypothetical protein
MTTTQEKRGISRREATGIPKASALNVCEVAMNTWCKGEGNDACQNGHKQPREGNFPDGLPAHRLASANAGRSGHAAGKSLVHRGRVCSAIDWRRIAQRSMPHEEAKTAHIGVNFVARIEGPPRTIPFERIAAHILGQPCKSLDLHCHKC